MLSKCVSIIMWGWALDNNNNNGVKVNYMMNDYHRLDPLYEHISADTFDVYQPLDIISNEIHKK